jgi:hypothetical protein
MILYILSSIIIIFLFILAYIRIKYRFWTLQPVFHFYDIYYWFVDYGIIMKELPQKNKYYQPKLETIKFESVSNHQLTKFKHLIHINYISNKEFKQNKFSPKKENIDSYFIGHNSPCFWSFYWEQTLLTDSKTNAIVEDKSLVSVITTRPLHLEINENRSKTTIKMDVYYVDYLCVALTHRKKGIAQQMIQTHEYNQRHSNKSIKVSLFKREDEMTGIVPLCIFDTYGFNIWKWTKPQDLPANLTFLLCDKQNMYYLFDFIKINKSKFYIHILPELSNIVELVESKNIFIYMLMEETTIKCAYFFRKTCTYVKEKEEVLSCFATINVSAPTKVFVHGFKVAFWKIKEKYDDYKYLVVEQISDSGVIIKNLVIKTHPSISPTAYFLYNFAYRTFDADKVLIIN